eukprot:Skav216881  [mRNA]  locus=scaffold1042:471751:485522:+ [translate_table: standard]
MSSAATRASTRSTALAAASSNVEIQDVNLFGEALKPCTQGSGKPPISQEAQNCHADCPQKLREELLLDISLELKSTHEAQQARWSGASRATREVSLGVAIAFHELNVLAQNRSKIKRILDRDGGQSQSTRALCHFSFALVWWSISDSCAIGLSNLLAAFYFSVETQMTIGCWLQGGGITKDVDARFVVAACRLGIQNP